MPALCPSLIGSALCQPIDIYCERNSVSFFAETLNAVSNFAFLVAGWLAWLEFRQRSSPRADPLLAAIVTIVPIVGLGSFIFHTLATRWASWVDVIPILIFMSLYTWLVMRRYFAWPRWLASTALLAFFFSTVGLEAVVPERVLWGGAMYLPTIAVFVAVAIASNDCSKDVRKTIAMAASLFLLGFTFRTLDAPLCESLPIGTHYLWHSLNAVVLYLLIHAAIMHGRTPFVTQAQRHEGVSRQNSP